MMRFILLVIATVIVGLAPASGELWYCKNDYYLDNIRPLLLEQNPDKVVAELEMLDGFLSDCATTPSALVRLQEETFSFYIRTARVALVESDSSFDDRLRAVLEFLTSYKKRRAVLQPAPALEIEYANLLFSALTDPPEGYEVQVYSAARRLNEIFYMTSISDEAMTLVNEATRYYTSVDYRLQSSYRSTYDEFKKTTYYNHIDGRTQPDVSLSLAQTDFGETYLKLTLRHIGSDWVFFENIYALADEQILPLAVDIDRSEKDTDVRAGRVYETFSLTVSTDTIEKLVKLANADVSKIRFSGRSRYSQLVLYDDTKKALRETIQDFQLLRRKLGQS